MIGKEVKKRNESGVWENIKTTLKFTYQSAIGKYSLETYLEVLGEYTDSEIIDFLEKGYTYGGGEVTFLTEKSEDTIKVMVKMYFFERITKKNKLKQAERSLEKNIFTDETIKTLEEKRLVMYEINEPEVM